MRFDRACCYAAVADARQDSPADETNLRALRSAFVECGGLHDLLQLLVRVTQVTPPAADPPGQQPEAMETDQPALSRAASAPLPNLTQDAALLDEALRVELQLLILDLILVRGMAWLRLSCLFLFA
jgi:hypothetical protein